MRWLEDLEDMLTTFANGADGPESPEAINAGILAEAVRRVKQFERDLTSRVDAHKRTIQALIGSSAECDALRLEVARLTRERDALIEACLTRYSTGRWGAFLGNYALGAFDSRDAAIREVFECVGLDTATVLLEDLKPQVEAVVERAKRAEAERDAALLALGRVLSGPDAVKPPAGELAASARKFVGLDAAPAGEEPPP